MQALCVLNLSHNHLQSLQGLESLKALVKLCLNQNNIKKMEHLDNLTNLVELDLSSNKIETIECVSTLRSLQNLNLQRNEIADITELPMVKELVSVNLSENKLENALKCGAVFVGLPKLAHLRMHGNPLSADSAYRMALLESTSLQTLDCIPITQHVRKEVARQRKDQAVGELIEIAHRFVIERRENERYVVNHQLEALRAKERELELTFSRYSEKLQRELDECISYLHLLQEGEGPLPVDADVLKDLLANEAQEHWKERQLLIIKEREERERHIQDELQETSREEKLVTIARAKPDVWREMKLVEMTRRMQEEMEESAKESIDEKERLRRKQAMYDQVAERLESVLGRSEKHLSDMMERNSEASVDSLLRNRLMGVSVLCIQKNWRLYKLRKRINAKQQRQNDNDDDDDEG